MKHTREFALWAAALMATISVLYLVQGCGTAPVAPMSTADGLAALGDADSQLGDRPIAQAKVVGSIVSAIDEVVVGASGGTIELLLGSATSTLSVPRGALEENVLITAAAVQLMTPFGKVTIYDFGPDGLVFSNAATLTLATDKAKGTSLSLYWYNPTTGAWEWQQTSQVGGDGKIQFAIWHFSKYGIG